MTRLTNPYPLFPDATGALLDAGYIYVGAVGSDPQVSPIQCYWDIGLTVPAAQPLRVLGGYIVNGGNRAFVFVAQDDYAMTVKDADSNLVTYTPSIAIAAPAYQPLDDDLTAIAALTTNAFGRSLLQLTDQVALKAATGIPAPIPATGGNVTGNIVRQGAGVHAYHVNPAYNSGRIFGPEYTTDPTSQPGDLWLKASG